MGLELIPESLVDTIEDNDAGSLVIDGLSYLATHPLDLNTASASELNQIPVFDPFLAKAIVSYRNQHGPFNTVHSIRIVPGVSDDIVSYASQFLTVIDSNRALKGGSKTRSGLPIDRSRFVLIHRYSRSNTRKLAGVTAKRYPEHLFTRLSLIHHSGLQTNLTLEKDPGEILRWHPASNTFLYDFVSGYISYSGKQILKSIVVGDFVMNTGQGLILWQKAYIGAGREPVRHIARFGTGLSPYASTDENRFFRGIAAAFSMRRLELSIFASRRSIDAVIETPDTSTTGNSSIPRILSLQYSGLHRTTAELQNKDRVLETAVGTSVSFTSGLSSVGFTAYMIGFDVPVENGNQPYQFYDFSGSSATLLSLNGKLQFKKVLFFSEIGTSTNGTPGGLAGVQVQQGRLADLVLHARFYPRDFHNLYGNAFAQQSGSPRNETGIYVGLRFTPGPDWKVTAYFDQYSFPWLKYGILYPSRGYEGLFSVTYTPRRWLLIYAQAKNEWKEEGSPTIDPAGHVVHGIDPATRQSLRVHGDYQFSKRMRLRARIELSRFDSQTAPVQKGILAYQELRWTPTRNFSIDARYISFDIDGYDARIYAYENSVRHAFSLPSFTGEGDRFYLLMACRILPGLVVQAKWAQSRVQNPLRTQLDTLRNEFTAQILVQR